MHPAAQRLLGAVLSVPRKLDDRANDLLEIRELLRAFVRRREGDSQRRLLENGSCDDVEGRIEAYDLGLPKDLNHEFAGLEAEESVQKEFDELKRRVQGETRQAADTE